MSKHYLYLLFSKGEEKVGYGHSLPLIGATTLSIMTLSIMTLNIMTFRMMTPGTMTLSIMTFSITENKMRHSA